MEAAMSRENVRKMFGKIEKDSVLNGKYVELMRAHQKETDRILADKLVELGKTSGFDFSGNDLLAARAELIDGTNANKELSENDLEKVAGGISRKVAGVGASFLSVGIACAVISIIDKSKGNSCEQTLSANGNAECSKW